MCKRIVSFLMVLMIFADACGSPVREERETEPQKEAQKQWGLKETILPDADETLESQHRPLELTCGMIGDTVYRVVWIYGDDLEITGSSIQRLEPPYSAWENHIIFRDEWVDGRNCYVRGASLGADGTVHMVLESIDGEGGRQYYRAEWNEASGHAAQQIPGEYFPDGFWDGVSTACMDREKNMYVLSRGGVQYFDSDFTEKREWEDSGNVWQFAENGEVVYLCGSSPEGSFRIWTINAKMPVFTAENVSMDSGDRVAFAGESSGFLCTREGIWRFDMENGGMDGILSYREQGDSVDKICGAAVGEDSTLHMVAIKEGQMVLMDLAEAEENGDVVELELAVVLPSPFLRKAVMDFNLQNTDCRVILREPEGAEDFADFRTRIQAEISGGSGPALLTNDVIELRDAARMGFLRDLTEAFEKEKGNLWENVWSLGETDGRLYGIPYMFSVQTLVTSERFCKGQEKWNLNEMMQCVRDSGAKAAVGGYEGSTLFAMLMLEGGADDELIDLENGKCCLEQEKVEPVLEFVKQYGDEESWERQGIRIAEGEVFAEIYNISNLYGAAVMDALFQGEAVYIGFPTAEIEGNGNILSGSTISINQSCQYQEEAAAFIAFVISAQEQDKLAGDVLEPGTFGFPVRREALENAFEYAGEVSGMETFMGSYGGYEYSGKLTEESLEKVRGLLQGARSRTEGADIIWEIFSEETAAYFQGSKSAQEICDTLQNRVQLYLDEMK